MPTWRTRTGSSAAWTRSRRTAPPRSGGAPGRSPRARAADRPDVETHALIYLGVARVGLGDEGGLDDVRAAIELARRLDHGEYLCRGASNLATALIWLGRHPEALPWLEVAEGSARDHGFDYHLFRVLVQRSQVDLFAGRWEVAERQLRELAGSARDPAALLVLPLAPLGRLLARRGDPAAAAMVARAWEMSVQSQQAYRMALAGGAVVEEAWLRGDAAGVRAAAAVLLPLATRAQLVHLRGETLRYLRRVGVEVEPFDRCPAGFAAGMRGDWRAAATAWAGLNPYEEALELTEAPDPRTAFDGLRRLDELGAPATAALVRRRLSGQGLPGVPRGPQRATRANPAAADRPPVRRARPARRGPQRRGDRRAAGAVAADGGQPRHRDPVPARRRGPAGGGGGRGRAGLARIRAARSPDPGIGLSHLTLLSSYRPGRTSSGGAVLIRVPQDWPQPLVATLAMAVLAVLDLAGALAAKEAVLRRSAGWAVLGVACFLALFWVYASSLQYAELAPVTFGWIVILQVGLVLLDRMHYGVGIPAGKWVAMVVIVAAQAYLILGPSGRSAEVADGQREPAEAVEIR